MKKLVINWDNIAMFCKNGTKGIAIARMFGMNEETLYKRCFLDNGINWSNFRAVSSSVFTPLMELRCFQFNEALDGNSKMLILLGKKLLKQSNYPIMKKAITERIVLEENKDIQLLKKELDKSTILVNSLAFRYYMLLKRYYGNRKAVSRAVRPLPTQ